MMEKISQFEGLSTRSGFNNSLNHFKLVMSLVEEIGDKLNLADIINQMVTEKSIEQEQIKPVLNALLFDKYGYYSISYNLEKNVEDFKSIVEEVKKWKAVDIVIAYYSPELGILCINPKNSEHWEAVRTLKIYELITIYVGAGEKTNGDLKLFEQAAKKMVDLLNGKKGKAPANFLKGSFTKVLPMQPVQEEAPKLKKAPLKRSSFQPKSSTNTVAPAASSREEAAPAQQAAAPAAKPARMTPMYGIVVQNELFHNGNVEAWKKIIQSYELSHAGLKVFVYYDGEQIHDLNTLFKWGKVKRGTAIMVSVGGDDIRDVARLQKYLKQGASHMFEAFLKGPPHQILKLF